MSASPHTAQGLREAKACTTSFHSKYDKGLIPDGKMVLVSGQK